MKQIKIIILTVFISILNITPAFVAGGGEELEHDPYDTSILDISILGSDLAQFFLMISLVLFVLSFIFFYISRRNNNI